jgi:threonyl-tRNA synthetase
VQAVVLPLSEKFVDYGRQVEGELKRAGLRAAIDESNEKLGAKIRSAQLEKVPFMLVVGEKEAESGAVAVRKRTGGDQGAMPLGGFIEHARGLIASRSLTLE